MPLGNKYTCHKKKEQHEYEGMKKNQGTVRNANTEQKEDSWTAKSMKKKMAGHRLQMKDTKQNPQ